MSITTYIDKSNKKQYKSFNYRTGISHDKDKLYLTVLDNKDYFNKLNKTLKNFEYFLDKLEVIDSKYNSLLYHQSNILNNLHNSKMIYPSDLLEAVKKGVKIHDALNFIEIYFEFEAFFMQLKGAYENTIRLFYWTQNRDIRSIGEIWSDKTKRRKLKISYLPVEYQELLQNYKGEIDLSRNLRDFFSHYSDMQEIFLELTSLGNNKIERTLYLPKEEFMKKGTNIPRNKLKIPDDYMKIPHYQFLNERYNKLEGFIIKNLRIIMDICVSNGIKPALPKALNKP